MSLRCSADTPVLPPIIRFQGQVGHDAMSAYGPKRTSQFALQMSAYDPKRTSQGFCTTANPLRRRFRPQMAGLSSFRASNEVLPLIFSDHQGAKPDNFCSHEFTKRADARRAP
jgi:hypothetical protein